MLSTADKVLYNKNKIRITRALLEYKGTEYPVRNISKVKLDKKEADDQPLIGFILVACLAAAAALVFHLPALILLGVILVLLCIFNPTEVEPTYKLIVTTNQGEAITLEPEDGDDMKLMKGALEQAIDMSDYR
jgi:fatty acid desaturase